VREFDYSRYASANARVGIRQHGEDYDTVDSLQLPRSSLTARHAHPPRRQLHCMAQAVASVHSLRRLAYSRMFFDARAMAHHRPPPPLVRQKNSLVTRRHVRDTRPEIPVTCALYSARPHACRCLVARYTRRAVVPTSRTPTDVRHAQVSTSHTETDTGRADARTLRLMIVRWSVELVLRQSNDVHRDVAEGT